MKKEVVEYGHMTEDQVADRILKCRMEGLCFVSLKKLDKRPETGGPVPKHKWKSNPLAAASDWYNGIEVPVAQMFVQMPYLAPTYQF